MSRTILGIHHITAICGDPQRNVDFYAGLLGLHLVKRTVNFDDPGTYHLYYGDGVGSPGTILTFFPWPGTRPGRLGNGQVTATAFAVPTGAFEFWIKRLAAAKVSVEGPTLRFGEEVISFADPDGMVIELIASANTDAVKAYQAGAIPVQYSIHGFHSATLAEAEHQNTAALLTQTLGFELSQQEGNRYRFAIAAKQPGTLVDIVADPEAPDGLVAGGTVHHIAWRTADDDQQREWLKTLNAAGHHSSPVMDRKYFHSIYFREPGGILFEIATDQPGFAIDEPVDQLGTSLVLPPWLESSRAKIEAGLPAIKVPVTQEITTK